MKRIDSIEDQMRGFVTYEATNGQRIRLDTHAVYTYGAAELMRSAGLPTPTERLPVIHHGQQVGTMAPDFDPDNVKSNSFWYDPRPGDFRRDGDTWVAARTLGPGDVDAVAGFVRGAVKRLVQEK